MTTTLRRATAPSPTTNPRPLAVVPPTGRRNRSRIAVGAVVVVVSVLASVSLYGRANERIEVVAIRQAVPAGAAIGDNDLTTVSIAKDTDLRTVPAAQRATIVGQVASVGLVPGSLLAPNQVASGPRVPNGMAITGATLKPGQYPIGLRADDEVVLVEVAPPTATGAAGAPIDRGRARVVEVVELRDAGSAVAVSLVMPSANAAATAAAGAVGRLTLVMVATQ